MSETPRDDEEAPSGLPDGFEDQPLGTNPDAEEGSESPMPGIPEPGVEPPSDG